MLQIFLAQDLNKRTFAAIAAAIMLHAFLFFNYINNAILYDDKTVSNLVGQSIAINISNFINSSPKKNPSLKKDHQNNSSSNKISENDFVPDDNFLPDLSKQEIITSSKFSTKGYRQLPKYPKRALKLRQQGVVYLRILLSEDGVSEKIEFVKKSSYPLLNKAAIEAVSQWNFEPIFFDGRAVKSWIEVPIEFKIS